MFQSTSDTVHFERNSRYAQSNSRVIDLIVASLGGSAGLACNPEAAMLITLVAMAFIVSLEPFRIGMTVLMLNRPRPMLQLLAFLCGGFAMGMTVGLLVVFVFRRTLLMSTYVTLPRVQMLIGVFALMVAATLIAMDRTNRLGPRPGMLAARFQRLLSGHSLWIAGLAGLGIALPSVDYLAALAMILASGTTATTQVGALLVFNLVAFALVEIPLLSYLLAPQTTHASMVALHDWIRSRRRAEVAVLLAAVGCALLAIGAAGL